ncbi:MAG: hypothetical protein ACRDZ2_11630, partial [Ilumatobacteraceae bacterium]
MSTSLVVRHAPAGGGGAAGAATGVDGGPATTDVGGTSVAIVDVTIVDVTVVDGNVVAMARSSGVDTVAASDVDGGSTVVAGSGIAVVAPEHAA